MPDIDTPPVVTTGAPPAATPATPATVEDYLSAQAAEWGTYVAATAIDINGARAFNVGDPVPVSHLESGVLDSDQVHKITTKAGRAAAGLPEKG